MTGETSRSRLHRSIPYCLAEMQQTARELAGLDVGQVAACPLYLFPCTPMGRGAGTGGHVLRRSLRRRSLLRRIEAVPSRSTTSAALWGRLQRDPWPAAAVLA